MIPSMNFQALPCYCATLRQAARAVTSIYEEAFAGSGIYATQFTIIQLLREAEALGTTELADSLGIDQTTATRMLALIEKAGLIQSHPGVDRRRRLWGLTAEGEKTRKRLMPIWNSAQETVEKLLGPSQAAALKKASFESAAKLIAAR
jgi:DNA-binding MarR family transcriptional regulator